MPQVRKVYANAEMTSILSKYDLGIATPEDFERLRELYEQQKAVATWEDCTEEEAIIYAENGTEVRYEG